MSTLVFARHAQASFFADDYDNLSARGVEQARQLGRYLAEQHRGFDEVYVGPRRRQRQTAELVGEALTAVGHDWPSVQQLVDLDEHHVDQLVIKHHRQIADAAPHLRELSAAWQSSNDRQRKQQTFQRFFEATTQLWAQGQFAETGVESWDAFRSRVNRAVDQIVTASGSGRHVLVSTSVGPITIALQRAVGCNDETALTTGWRVWNCSLTEFAFSGARFTLQKFNSLPHLRDRSQWTYR